jgi:hypothetical protein
VSDPYEPPLHAEVVVNSSAVTVEAGTRKIMRTLEELDYIPRFADSVYSKEEADIVEDRLRALGYM